MAARQTRRRRATTYAAGSFFGWLDYDENETEGFRKTFELFEDKETVDSIGIAPIRDALKRSFPGDQHNPDATSLFLLCSMDPPNSPGTTNISESVW